MANTKRPGSGNKRNHDTVLPDVLSDDVGTLAPESPLRTTILSSKLIDFDDSKLSENWRKIIDSQRKTVETDVLKITPPRSKLDPIAKGALVELRKKLMEYSGSTDDSDSSSFSTDEDEDVRAFITRNGIASEVKRVTDRLNARRITDGRRWVLTTAYEFILAKLFRDHEGQAKRLIKDDLGVAEKILLELEAKGGPLDAFVNLIIDSVMDRNRINPSNTLRELVAQKVRAAI
jgi:hypothetical protein